MTGAASTDRAGSVATNVQKVYLVCGVPGSGKTWACEQLKDKFTYVPNDEHIGGDHLKEVYRAARSSEKPVLADCPFAERIVRETLTNQGLYVIPVFVVEDPQLIKKRYEAREGKPIPTSHLTRALNMQKRAEDWRAFFGTSEEVFQHLRDLQCQ